jgi:hypothetical protein
MGITYLTLEDKIDPEIYCNSEVDTVTCFDIQFQFPDYYDCQPDTIKLIAQTFDSICVDSLIYRVTRTYRASDLWGNESECTEEYVVKRININQVDFPTDLEISCDTIDNFLDKNGMLISPPLNLPMGIDTQKIIYPFGVPTFSGSSLYGPNLVDCSVRAFYEDLGPINSGCHVRFMREWTVYEWYCNEEVERTMLQVIEVVDTVAPEFAFTQDTVYYYVDADSCKTDIVLSTLPYIGPVDNCTDEDDLIIDIAVFFNGNYNSLTDTMKDVTLDTLELRIQVSDKCHQNTTMDTITIIVKDSIPPIPVVMDSMKVSLTDTITKVAATSFNVGSLDWCGGALDFGIRRMEDEVYADSVALTCADSSVMVVIQVVDQFGNAGIAMVDVEVSDPSMLCPATASGSSIVSGYVRYEDGTPMSQIPVYATGPENIQTVTGEDGFFSFEELNTNFEVTLTPVYDENHTDGITTFDIILMQRHLLGLDNLDSPYKVIAADVNGNGKLNASDIFELRKLILADTDKLNGTTSYVFVPATMTFHDPLDPWDSGDIFNAHLYSTVPSDPIELTGIKVGDVSKNSLHASARSVSGTSQWTYSSILKNGQLTIDVFAESYTLLEGFQATLRFDPAELDFVDFVPGLIHIRNENFSDKYLDQGLIPVSWNDFSPREIKPGEPIFSLVFRSENMLSPQLGFTSWPVLPETYESSGRQDLQLKSKIRAVDSFTILGISPNPWASNTVLDFHVKRAEEVQLKVFDLYGKVLLDETIEPTLGENSYRFDNALLPGTGMYYIHISNGIEAHTSKMIKLRD